MEKNIRAPKSRRDPSRQLLHRRLIPCICDMRPYARLTKAQFLLHGGEPFFLCTHKDKFRAFMRERFGSRRSQLTRRADNDCDFVCERHGCWKLKSNAE